MSKVVAIKLQETGDFLPEAIAQPEVTETLKKLILDYDFQTLLTCKGPILLQVTTLQLIYDLQLSLVTAILFQEAYSVAGMLSIIFIFFLLFKRLHSDDSGFQCLPNCSDEKK